MANYLLGKRQNSFHVIYPHITWKLPFQGPRRRSERRWGSGRGASSSYRMPLGKSSVTGRFTMVWGKARTEQARLDDLPAVSKAPALLWSLDISALNAVSRRDNTDRSLARSAWKSAPAIESVLTPARIRPYSTGRVLAGALRPQS
jgi:hypothetical protein